MAQDIEPGDSLVVDKKDDGEKLGIVKLREK